MPPDQHAAITPDSPTDAPRPRLGAEPPAMDTLQVAPHAERGEILGLVAAPLRTKSKVMRRHIAALADRTRAAISIPLVDGLEGTLAEQRGAPDIEEVLTQARHEAPPSPLPPKGPLERPIQERQGLR